MKIPTTPISKSGGRDPQTPRIYAYDQLRVNTYSDFGAVQVAGTTTTHHLFRSPKVYSLFTPKKVHALKIAIEIPIFNSWHKR